MNDALMLMKAQETPTMGLTPVMLMNTPGHQILRLSVKDNSEDGYSIRHSIVPPSIDPMMRVGKKIPPTKPQD
jgi:hypothetical protein